MHRYRRLRDQVDSGLEEGRHAAAALMDLTSRRARLLCPGSSPMALRGPATKR
jgi:hypothetical protein